MPGWLTTVIGAAEIAAGVITGVVAGWTGVGAAFAVSLIGMGIGTVISGVGTMLSGSPLSSTSTAAINPTSAQEIPYGRNLIGGTVIFDNEWGDNNKYRDIVILLADCSCQDVYGLQFNRQRIQMDTAAVAPGVPASVYPAINGGTSFTPLEQTVTINSIARYKNVVTVSLAANIPLLVEGDQIIIKNVTGDKTLNGQFAVYQILQQSFGGPGFVTFTYLNGGSTVSYSGQGQAKTTWPDFGRKVYMEVMTGKQTLGQTFVGMGAAGSPNDGNTGDLIAPDTNPWTANCSCVGKTVAWLRVHYNDVYFANGLPNISFLVHGKDDIYDPRTTSTGYTENAALCAADVLLDQTWGYKCVLGEDPALAAPGRTVNTTHLIDAANVCDESVLTATPISSPPAAEPRYALNGRFQLTMKRGEILSNMLTACAGRITFDQGSFKIWPAAWYPTHAGTTIVGPVNICALVGAFVDAGGNVIQPVLLGTAATFTVPIGAVALLMGANDDNYSDNVGSWVIDVNGTHYTVPGNAQPWVHTGGINSAYPFGLDNGVAPTSVPVTAGTTLLSLYVSGTAAPNGTLTPTDSDGGNYFTGTFDPATSTYYPSKWIQGQVIVLPGFSTSINSVTPWGPVKWRVTGKGRETFNGVMGTYIHPANNWQSTDFPPYAQDVLHGYASDLNLAYDGGDRLWLNIQLPFTISCAAAQRLAKIEFLRRRNAGGNSVGTGTIPLSMAGYQQTALDIVTCTFSGLSWLNKLMEVASHQFKIEPGEDGAIRLSTVIDVQETLPSTYDWSVTEELSPAGYTQSGVPGSGGTTPSGPTNVIATIGPGISVNEAGGVGQCTILVTWTAPADGYVSSGGRIEAQYQIASSPPGPWIALPSVPPSVTQITITGVANGSSYTIQIRSVNAAGIPSPWVLAMTPTSPPLSVITVVNAMTELYLINGV